MSSILGKSLTTGVLTEKDPFGVSVSFGFPVIDFSRCTACDACARSCPTGAILTEVIAKDRKTLSLSYAACIQCRECVAQCPEEAVGLPAGVEVAAYTREQLARKATFDVDPATGRGTFRGETVVAGLSLTESAARLRERIRGRLGRSLHVRQVDAGSCNGCELEIAATTNPLYDLERFGSTSWRVPATPTSSSSPVPSPGTWRSPSFEPMTRHPSRASWSRSAPVGARVESSARAPTPPSAASTGWCRWTSTSPAVPRVLRRFSMDCWWRGAFGERASDRNLRRAFLTAVVLRFYLVIVDCAVYREGKRVPGDFSPESAFKASRCDDTFVWIGLHKPTEEEFPR